MSDDEAASITLVGRTSAWRRRLPAGAADWSDRPPRSARGGRPLIASWLHHPGYGTLGAYLAATATAHWPTLRRGQWVQLVGLVRPFLAYALPDDPRSVVCNDMTPLLIEATQLALAPDRRWQPPLPMLPSARQARVLRAPSSARIAPLAHWADAVFWQDGATRPRLGADWDTVRGIVTKFGERRYLRYVLSLSASAARIRPLAEK